MSLAATLRHLGRLKERMQRAGFPPDDPLFGSVSHSFDAIPSLNVHLHYAGRAGGAGALRGC